MEFDYFRKQLLIQEAKSKISAAIETLTKSKGKRYVPLKALRKELGVDADTFKDVIADAQKANRHSNKYIFTNIDDEPHIGIAASKRKKNTTTPSDKPGTGLAHGAPDKEKEMEMRDEVAKGKGRKDSLGGSQGDETHPGPIPADLRAYEHRENELWSIQKRSGWRGLDRLGLLPENWQQMTPKVMIESILKKEFNKVNEGLVDYPEDHWTPMEDEQLEYEDPNTSEKIATVRRNLIGAKIPKEWANEFIKAFRLQGMSRAKKMIENIRVSVPTFYTDEHAQTSSLWLIQMLIATKETDTLRTIIKLVRSGFFATMTGLDKDVFLSLLRFPRKHFVTWQGRRQTLERFAEDQGVNLASLLNTNQVEESYGGEDDFPESLEYADLPYGSDDDPRSYMYDDEAETAALSASQQRQKFIQNVRYAKIPSEVVEILTIIFKKPAGIQRYNAFIDGFDSVPQSHPEFDDDFTVVDYILGFLQMAVFLQDSETLKLLVKRPLPNHIFEGWLTGWPNFLPKTVLKFPRKVFLKWRGQRMNFAQFAELSNFDIEQLFSNVSLGEAFDPADATQSLIARWNAIKAKITRGNNINFDILELFQYVRQGRHVHIANMPANTADIALTMDRTARETGEEDVEIDAVTEYMDTAKMIMAILIALGEIDILKKVIQRPLTAGVEGAPNVSPFKLLIRQPMKYFIVYGGRKMNILKFVEEFGVDLKSLLDREETSLDEAKYTVTIWKQWKEGKREMIVSGEGTSASRAREDMSNSPRYKDAEYDKQGRWKLDYVYQIDGQYVESSDFH